MRIHEATLTDAHHHTIIRSYHSLLSPGTRAYREHHHTECELSLFCRDAACIPYTEGPTNSTRDRSFSSEATRRTASPTSMRNSTCSIFSSSPACCGSTATRQSCSASLPRGADSSAISSPPRTRSCGRPFSRWSRRWRHTAHAVPSAPNTCSFPHSFTSSAPIRMWIGSRPKTHPPWWRET